MPLVILSNTLFVFWKGHCHIKVVYNFQKNDNVYAHLSSKVLQPRLSTGPKVVIAWGCPTLYLFQLEYFLLSLVVPSGAAKSRIGQPSWPLQIQPQIQYCFMRHINPFKPGVS